MKPQLTELAVVGNHGDHSDHMATLVQQHFKAENTSDMYQQGLEQKDIIISWICTIPVESRSN